MRAQLAFKAGEVALGKRGGSRRIGAHMDLEFFQEIAKAGRQELCKNGVSVLLFRGGDT
jgi:hypothetical protein